MRNDSVGLFWDDTPEPKPPKAEKEKRTPPEKTWLSPDYLPGLEEALRFPVQRMTDADLASAKANGDEFVTDTECYTNYWLAMFTSLTTGKVYYMETVDGPLTHDQKMRLEWILRNVRTSGFNSLSYDLTMCALALGGLDTSQLKECSDEMIVYKARPQDILKRHKLKKLKINHIDIIDVCPLEGSLKTYAGRVHAPKLQDLPFPPETVLSPAQIAIVRWYCVNDTISTAFVRMHQQEHIDLRVQLSNQYKVDLRSKSDAQLAEAIIATEIQRLTGQRPKPPGPLSAVGVKFHYKPPAYISFQTPELQRALAEMCAAEIEVGPSGHCLAPKAIREQKVKINGKPYTVGLGGLHSKEKKQALVAGPLMRLIDRDVTGYYPNLILKNGFAPAHLGQVFLIALQALVDRRTLAKKVLETLSKDDPRYETVNAEAGGLKIANNGIFGKTSDPYSIVYAPKEMVQITITGQLSLLMAIEALELSGIPVVSANTDGIVMACPVDKYDHMRAVFAGWERVTALETEETEYAALYAANVNNYIAFTLKGKVKTKGWYCERGSAQNSVLSKNPEVLVCSEAVQAYLSKGVPLEQSIRGCRDMRKFVSLRVVNGGGVKVWGDERPPEFLGKTARWYYGKDATGEIVYAKNGNKVGRSDGAVPYMEMRKHDELPQDLDYDWYVAKSENILRDVGAWAN